jgi:hydrogenase-4 component F
LKLDSSILFAILLAGPAAAAAVSLLPIEGVEISASIAAGVVALGDSLLILVEKVSGSFGGFFYSDGLTQVMAFTVSAIFLTSVVYSKFYVQHVKEPLFKFRWYYSLVDLFAFTMLLSIVVNDLGFIWIAVEATTVTSALLVALERERTSIEAAWRYTLIVSAGLAISLLSVVFVYYSEGTLTISQLMTQATSNASILAIAVAFALVGYGTKAGIAPMHTWLPDAHSEAPSPISAMFSGILLPTSLYAFTRTFELLRGTSTFGSMQDLAIGFGLFTAIVAAVIMGFQRNYKRMLAYSSMENMGIILVGLALGGVGTIGAIIQIVAHAFAKSSAFYGSGNIFVSYNSKKMLEVQGVIGKLRSTGYLFSLSCFSIAGAPPFGVFIGEFLILIQAFNTENYLVGAVLAIAYMYSFIGLNRQSIKMIFGSQDESENLSTSSKDSSQVTEQEREDRLSIAMPLINLAVSLIIGLYMFPVLLQAATSIGL